MSCDCDTNLSCCKSVGITSSLSNGVIGALEVCKTLKCKCVQIVPEIHVFDPQKKEAQRAETLKFCVANNLSYYSHLPIWLNVAPDSKSDINNIVNKSKGIITSQLTEILDLPAACILHIGNNGTIENVAERLNSMNIAEGKYMKKPLLLEGSAGTGHQLGSNWDEIRKLFETIDKPVGFCGDSQHLFASGMCDWKDSESVVKLFDKIEESSKGIGLIHLNDSKVDFKSLVDRHASIKFGKIWYKSQESLITLLARCRDDNINMVLETGDNQLKDLKTIDKLMEIE
jgi:endonuclease IV